MKPGTRNLKLIALLALALLLLLHAQPLYAVGLQNWAMFRLQPLWRKHAEPILDPPCRASGAFSDLVQMFRPNIALGNARALTHVGRVLWLEGRCTEAITTWKKAWVDAHDLGAAFELIRVGEYDALPQEMRRTVAESFYQHAREVSKTRGDRSALLWFSRAFDLAPHHKYAGAIAQTYRKEGDTASERHIWQRLANLTLSSDAEHWWAVAELASLDSKWEAAALAYTEGAQLTAEPYGFWVNAGSAWLQAHQLDSALAAYERAYQEMPTAWSCMLLGNVYRARQQYAEALQWYAEALVKSPHDAEVYYRFGDTYYAMGEYARAQEYLDQALQIDADHFLSMYLIAKMLNDQGDAVNAEKWMLDALARIPWREASAVWWLELGDWRLQRRDCEGARVAYTHAREMNVTEQTIQSKARQFTEICGQ